MLIKWIYSESRELCGIKRNKGDSFEIDDNTGQRLINQGKAVLCAQDGAKNEVSEGKKGKNKGGK